MIRCRECDHSNPDDHRFCGICGAKLEPADHPLAIDEDDPLELETPVYQFEDRSGLRQPAEVNRRDRQREQVRDTSSISSNGSRKSRQAADINNLPREIIEPTVDNEYAENTRSPSSGIGGPSFLGLNYESESNHGFVYDDPRQGGFIYDTDAEAPEYLLEEVSRGVSWRAWALFLLLIVGGGLGYIQWRASHHQGPDLASILARNGPTVDPSGPVLPDKSSKSADKTNSADNSSSSNTGNAKANSETAENKNAAASPNADNDEDSSVIDAGQSAAKSADAERGTAKAAAKTDDAKTEDKTEESSDTANLKSAAKNSKSDEDAKSANPESDGPVGKSGKAAHRAEVADEEPAQPKSLGEKDPLMIQADKYIQGRGVRKNCSMGINLLRQAVSEGNPAASVKLGALYWSGTCVTQSKVTAYQWFSRAHSLEPKNRWIERSRNSLWASMSPAEQRKTSY
jgi:hypothetical protein